jgi:hypothetical protein
MNSSESRRLEAVARGRAWADERAARLRDRVPAEQWPECWDDADDGVLPSDPDSAEELRLRMAASRAAHERWRELITQQCSVEALQEREQVVESRAWPPLHSPPSAGRG